MRQYVSAKLHGLTVTATSIHYTGSVTIDVDLLKRAAIDPYERVFIVNLNTGGRWDTYVLPGQAGEFALNGGGARLGMPGDRCVVMTYQIATEAPGAEVLFLDADNNVVSTTRYEGRQEPSAG